MWLGVVVVAVLVAVGPAGGGAVSRAQAASVTFSVNTTDDTVDANPGDGTCADSSGACSLRAAVMEANAQAGADPSKEFVIQLGAGSYVLLLGQQATGVITRVFGDTVGADQDDLDVAANLTIEGQSATDTVVEACTYNNPYPSTWCSFRIFEVMAGASLELRNLKVSDGYVQDDSGTNGGAVYVHAGATFAAANVAFESNDSESYNGGAIYNEGTVTISGSTFEYNGAGEDGGAIYNAGTVTISESTFYGNDADSDGGAIYNDEGATLTVENSEFAENEAEYAGAISSDGTLTVRNSTFTNNSATYSYGDGGAINSGGTLDIENSTFTGNFAGQDGGAIYISSSASSTIEGSKFSGNTANYGGAIYGSPLIVGSVFDSNWVTAIFGDPVIVNSTVYNNQGGGIFGSPIVLFSTIANNAAGPYGGGGIDGGGRFKGTIIAGNTPSNCNLWDDYEPEGINLSDDDSCRGFAQVSDAGLGTFDSTAGVIPLLPASPAVGAAVDCADFDNQPVSADQRGVARPQPASGRCDAGAYELEGVSASPLTVSPGQTQDVGTIDAISGEGDATFTITNGGAASVAITLQGPYDLGLDGTAVEPDTTCDGATLDPGQSCTVKLHVVATGWPGKRAAAVALQVSGAEPLYLLVTADVGIERTFTVNTTEYHEEPEAALGDGRCDYDLSTDGDQCSLTAALTEVGTWDVGVFTIVLGANETYYFPAYQGTSWVRQYETGAQVTVQGNGSTISGGVDPASCSTSTSEWASWEFRSGGGLTLQDVTFEKFCFGTAPVRVALEGGQLTLDNVTFRDNVNLDTGYYATSGALSIWSSGSSTVTIQQSHFANNQGEYGGGLHLSGLGTVTVEETTFEGNAARGAGGALYLVVGGNATIQDTTFTDNTAEFEGGGLYVRAGYWDDYWNFYPGNVEIVRSRFVQNATGPTGEGGGIWASAPLDEEGGPAPSVVVRESAVLDNQAGSEGGGGIYVGGPCDAGPLKLVNVTIAGNTTTGTGGGIDAGFCDRVHLSFVTITGNTAQNGGGIYAPAGSDASFKNLKGTIVVGNTATGTGPECAGPWTSLGGNVVGDTSGCTVTWQSTDSTDASAASVLGSRDGATGTYPLVTGSPAVGKVADCKDADGADVTSDQRGQSRPDPSGSACDAGAYESEEGTSAPTPTPTPTPSATPTPTPTPTATPTSTPPPSGTPTPSPTVTATPTPTPVPPSGGPGSGGGVRVVTVASPTGSGSVRFELVSPAGEGSLSVTPVNGAPAVPVPAGYELPHGLYGVTVSGLTPGASATIEVTLPSPIPEGTVWLKLVSGSWVPLPVGEDDGDAVIRVALTDGGPGDGDGAANGVVVDPAGPAVPYVTYGLEAAWSMVSWWGADGEPVAEALGSAGLGSRVRAVYGFDAERQEWEWYFPELEGGPIGNTLAALERGGAYWVAVSAGPAVEWRYVGRLPEAGEWTYRLWPGWTAVAWVGTEGVDPAAALEGTGAAGRVTAVYWWDREEQRWHGYFPGAPAASDLGELRRGEVYWVALSGSEPVDWLHR